MDPVPDYKELTLKELVHHYQCGDDTTRSDAISVIMERLGVEDIVRGEAHRQRNDAAAMLNDSNQFRSTAQFILVKTLPGISIDDYRDDNYLTQYLRKAIRNGNLDDIRKAKVRKRREVSLEEYMETQQREPAMLQELPTDRSPQGIAADTVTLIETLGSRGQQHAIRTLAAESLYPERHPHTTKSSSFRARTYTARERLHQNPLGRTFERHLQENAENHRDAEGTFMSDRAREINPFDEDKPTRTR